MSAWHGAMGVDEVDLFAPMQAPDEGRNSGVNRQAPPRPARPRGDVGEPGPDRCRYQVAGFVT